MSNPVLIIVFTPTICIYRDSEVTQLQGLVDMAPGPIEAQRSLTLSHP